MTSLGLLELFFLHQLFRLLNWASIVQALGLEMAPRCSGSSSAFLPFLYPSLFLTRIPQRAPRIAYVLNVRHHISESGAPDDTAARLNPNPDDFYQTNFADRAKLHIHGGPGGSGCISFAREAYLPDGPPNGGDGGSGGNVYIQAVHSETSLHKLARRRIIRATRGTNGQGKNKGGKRGDDIIIDVPVGTVVKEISREDPEGDERQHEAFLKRNAIRVRKSQEKDAETRKLQGKDVEEDSEEEEEPKREEHLEEDEEEEEEENENMHRWLLYPGASTSEKKRIKLPELPQRDRLFAQPRGPIIMDLSKPTPRPILLAIGGIGGLGNPHFSSREMPRPLFATTGERPVSMQIELELKLLADVGLVGLPNAGKSTLVRALTNSRARVGSWAFTTLQPNIGTVVLDTGKGRPLVTSYHRQEIQDTWDKESEVVLRTRFTIADIPGLIEGAHLDKGLGIAFLRHVERAGVLAFVVDLSNGNAVKALKALWTEVGLYAQMREDEETDREREARIEHDLDAGTGESSEWREFEMIVEHPPPPAKETCLTIAGKPWFVVATKGDLPDTQENFKELRDYLAKVISGDEPHPSGVNGAWVKNPTAIPVSALKGQGVQNIVHWCVGLLDG